MKNMNENIRRTCKTFIIILLILVVQLFPIVSPINVITQKIKISQIVIRVDDDGDGDYTNIQDAIDNASKGDIIEVYSGMYIDENVSVDKQLILKGIDKELGSGNSSGKPIIIGEIDHQPNMGLITIRANECSVSGFHLKEKEGSYCKEGIAVHSNNNDIFENVVEDTNFGIDIYWETSNNSVYNNSFPGCFYGIITYSINNQIYNNYITNSYGITIGNIAESNFIYGNIIDGSIQRGIELHSAKDIYIYENTIKNCKNGIHLGIDSDCNMTIFNNNIINCNKGIFIDGNSFTDHNKIWGNNISSCGIGIDISGGEHLIYKNDISSCNNGMKISGDEHLIYENKISGCINSGIKLNAGYNIIFENNIEFNQEYGLFISGGRFNHIYHNNFINNKINAFCNYYFPNNPFQDYNQWNLDYITGGGGNYWSDYTGRDTNRDGVGDSSYIIPDNFPNPLTNDKDKYPLIEPDGRPNSRSNPVYRLDLFRIRFLEHFPFLEKLLYFLSFSFL
jgi:nitrous oxidase accessory protein NosD